MPSAVRQRIPAELWYGGRHSPSSHCAPLQASPVQPDTIQAEDAKHRHTPRKPHHMQQQKKHRSSTVRLGSGSNTPPPRRGSSEDLNMGRASPKCQGKASVMSGQVQQGDVPSGVPSSNNAFAIDATVPPHPSQLPMPPMEWLRPNSQSPPTVGHSIQTLLACKVTA